MRKTYIIARILKEVEEIRKQIEIMNVKSGKCEHEFAKLSYCCDADYDIKDSAVWSWDRGYKEKTFCYCKKCGQVFVRD